MIKRALGIFAGGEDDDGDDGSDSDPGYDGGLTVSQRKKLERRLVPGAKGSEDSSQRGQRSQKKPAQRPDDSDSRESDESDESGVDSEDEPAVPASSRVERSFRGEFHCQLCPDKVLLNEKLMEAHLQSAEHKRNERRFERAKAMGVEAYEDECRQNAADREQKAMFAAAGVANKKQRKSQEFWTRRKERAASKDKVKEDSKGEKSKDSKDEKSKSKAGELTASQIEVRKQRFQEKKGNRQARREAEKSPGGVRVAETASKPQVKVSTLQVTASKPQAVKSGQTKEAVKSGHFSGRNNRGRTKKVAAKTAVKKA
ncbi:unnamed protein product, partial [Polarella glacialis]